MHTNGGRWWRQRYFWVGKEKLLSVGTYPEVSLSEARDRGTAVRKKVACGVDPSADRQEQKVARLEAAERSYKKIVTEWLAKTGTARKWSADHIERVQRRFATHFFPWLGHKDIAGITDDDILVCIRRLEDRNLIDTAHRALSENDAMFRYAKQRKYVKDNVVADLRGPDTLPAVKVKHHAALKDPTAVGGLLRAIDSYHGGFVTRCALRFLTPSFRTTRRATASNVGGVRSRPCRVEDSSRANENGRIPHRASIKAGCVDPARIAFADWA